MLKRLIVNNLAILENIDIPFQNGFTVLTGETGAGKSLIIDSLSLLLGARASNELIRQGEEKASLKGIFDITNPRLEAFLWEKYIPFEDRQLIIERVLSKTKSSIKANGVAISLTDLGIIAPFLANIHSQFDFTKILNPENYLEMIDGYSSSLVLPYRQAYTEALTRYRQQKADYETWLEKKEKLDASRDLYEFQYQELRAAHLQEGEEEAIAEQLSLLRNRDKIFALTQEADGILHGDFLDQYYQLNEDLAKLARYQPQYQELHDELDSKYYEVTDLCETLKEKFRHFDYDPGQLDELEERDSDLAALKRKYHRSIAELIAYQKELDGLLGEKSSFDDTLQEKKQAADEAFHLAYQKGVELHQVRERVAKTIEKEVMRSLKDLLLEARFSIVFNPLTENESALRENGIDVVDFFIETNVGEGMKSLSKVVSGGEASRIMLAFKSIFLQANRIPTVVFDEIDTGISGRSAEAVAKKIKEISLSTQVIAITHLPQVAALADHAILIHKEVRGNRTYSRLKELNLDEKIEQVAYLISGGKITEKQREYAKELVLDQQL